MKNKYIQPVVWIGTVLGDSTPEEFNEYFKEIGFRVKYDKEFKMVGGYYKGLTCTIFQLHINDIPKFAMFRLKTDDMKWMEDFIDHHGLGIPMEILNEYADKQTLQELMEAC